MWPSAVKKLAAVYKTEIHDIWFYAIVWHKAYLIYGFLPLSGTKHALLMRLTPRHLLKQERQFLSTLINFKVLLLLSEKVVLHKMIQIVSVRASAYRIEVFSANYTHPARMGSNAVPIAKYYDI